MRSLEVGISVEVLQIIDGQLMQILVLILKHINNKLITYSKLTIHLINLIDLCFSLHYN